MKVRCLSVSILNVILLISLSASVYGNVYNTYYSQAVPISAETPKVILRQGTAGTSIIYTNNTSAKVSLVAYEQIYYPYYPSSYDIPIGTYFSGSIPSSIEAKDADYFVVRSTGNMMSTAYNPSGYSLLGSTALVSGTTMNLLSDDSNYMTFRSYVSATSPSLKTNAFVAYRDSTTTLNTPKERTWTGESTLWGSQTEMVTAGSPVRFVRTAYCPIESRSFEKIVVTLSDDGYLDAYVWDGTSWDVTNNIAFTGTVANAYKCFDVAYEKTSGRALLVYSRGTTTNEIGYRIWTFGAGWGSEQFLDLAYTTGVVYWISLAMAPGTRPGTADDNEIALIYLDANADVHGYVWTGSTWSLMGATAVWDATAAIATEECIAVAYEQVSGRAMFIWGDSVATDNYNRIWDGLTLSGPTLAPDITTQGAVTNWVTLKSNPASNELVYLVVDGAFDLNTAYWSGSAWTIHAEHDGTVDTHAQRCADFAWEPTGSKGLLVWGTTPGRITYRTFTAPNTWGTLTNQAMGANVHPWVQLRTNPRNIPGDTRILGVVLEGTVFDIGAIRWDGTTFTVIGTSTISADTTVITYECFEMEFMLFGPATEFTCELEFSGTSNTQSWTQLVWAIDSCFTTTSVTVTFQLYDYITLSYPTSGDGYMTDIIGTSDVTKTQTITTIPTRFRDATGNWKIKVKCVKATTTQFDFKADWIEFRPTYSNEYTVSTEFLFSSMATSTPKQLNFTIVSEYDVANVSVTIQIWNYSSSAYVTSGEGYLTYTSSGLNETKLLSINTNPQFYTSNGKAKIRVTGVLATSTQYQQKVNQVKLVYSPSSNYNYVLKIENTVSNAWNIRLKTSSTSNITRLNNCTIYFHNSSDDTSRQIYIENGNCTQDVGLWYSLPSLTTIYIAMTVSATDTGTSYVYVYLEVCVPGTSNYNLMVITFEIS